jgi:hypothetical protein
MIFRFVSAFADAFLKKTTDEDPLSGESGTSGEDLKDISPLLVSQLPLRPSRCASSSSRRCRSSMPRQYTWRTSSRPPAVNQLLLMLCKMQIFPLRSMAWSWRMRTRTVSSLVSTSFPVFVLAIVFLIVLGSSPPPAKCRGGGSDAVKKLKKQKVAESE